MLVLSIGAALASDVMRAEEEDASAVSEEVREGPNEAEREDPQASRDEFEMHGMRGPAHRRGVGLPTLLPRLRSLGLYNEYIAWRNAYLNWRRGGARGAEEKVFKSLISRRTKFFVFKDGATVS